MDLICPTCHKHRFKPRDFWSSRFGGREMPVCCPHCGAMYSLDKKSGNIINLITFAVFFGYLVPAIVLLTPLPDSGVIAMAVGGIAVTWVARVFAISRFGRMESYEVKRSEPYPRIKLPEVRFELDRLKKNRDFFVLYAPDESAYISFGLDDGAFIADLAFAVGKFEELEPSFRAAAGKAGTKVKPYKKRNMRGVEAELGSDLDTVAAKVQTIMREVFHLKADAEVPVMRN